MAVTTGGSDSIKKTESEEEDPQKRAEWGGKLEFLLTCIGYAVGLGNVWRFPYLAYKNGGGAFLVPYVIMLALVGLPLFFMELSFGQFASLGPITIWKINPLLKGLGYCMVTVSWLIGLYYNVVIAHTLFYLVSSFTSKLPWEDCRNDWNTDNCVDKYMNISTSSNTSSLNYTSPSEEYYEKFVLEVTDGIDDPGGMGWRLPVALLVAWIVVLLVLIRGIETLGKVVYFTAIFPYIMLTILLVRGVTLPGAAQGIEFYLKPDFSKLGDSRVWSDAATQIFYSLSACSGGLIAMSSYNKFHNDCHRDALIVSLINCGTSVYAGFVIFSVLGFMAHSKGVSVAEVAKGGPGLAFVVYPEAIARMPVAPLWSVFFFIMMATLGFGSEFSMVECVLSALTDEFPEVFRPRKNNIIFRCVIIILSFLLGLPMVSRGGIYLLNLVDYSVGGFPLLFVGFFELVALNWIYGYEQFSSDIQMMLGSKPNIYWKACWVVISPLVILVTIVFNCVQYKPPSYDSYLYPEWALGLGWLIALFPILMVPVWFFYRSCRVDGAWEFYYELMRPLPTWGPASEDLHKQYWQSEDPLTMGDGKGEMNLGYMEPSHSNLSEAWLNSLTGNSTPGSVSTLSKVPSTTVSSKAETSV